MFEKRAIREIVQIGLSSAFILAFCVFICESSAETADDSSVKKETNDPKFHSQLLKIAAEYQDYGKVDDMARWAPTLCIMPPPPKARLSQSKDASTHGKKLYYLFAKHRNEYMENKTDVAGQVVVKESWRPPSDEVLASAAAEKSKQKASSNQRHLFEPDLLGPKSGLFIMYFADAKTPDTDEGWVYGTVTADGKTVTSAGRVESCMGCHISAPHGKLFGLQK